MSTISDIRQGIASSHDAIEKTPYSIAMMSGAMRRDDYANGLAQLMFVHRAMETSLASTDGVKDFFEPEMERTETIRRDLLSLGFLPDSFSPITQTSDIVSVLNRWQATKPASLLGCLYILEGSRMGSLVIARPLAASLGLPRDTAAGTEYHTQGAQTAPARLRRLKDAIDSSPYAIDHASDIADGAVTFMDRLNVMYGALNVRPAESQTKAVCPFSSGRTAQLRSA